MSPKSQYKLLNNKYKVEFFAANGLLSSTYFDDNHRIYFREGYMEIERTIMGYPRIVFSVKEDRVSKVWRHGQLVYEQYIGYLGGH